jgi:large-conductance mechanosensitive channel
MMKKRELLFLFIVILLLVLGLVFKDFISASIFDTFAAYQSASLNITIDAYPPDLIIGSPINTDYSEDNLVDINYSVSDSLSPIDTVWYNLNGGANTTLAGNTTTRIAKGDYILYMYANDTVNLLNGSESVSFSVSSESFKQVNFSHFDVPTSTNFSSMNDTELESITSLTLAKNGYGKVIFSQVINISESIDLDTYADISDNSVYINSEVLPNLDKPATLYLYGLTFTNPRILKDGSVCPESVCTEVSYSGGTLEFTVTGFTNYSSEETPTTPGPTGQTAGGGEGGGGGKKISFPEFKVTPELIKVKLKQGETKSEAITVENTGETILEFVIDLTDVKKFAVLSDYAFDLLPGQSKKVTAAFTASVLTEPDVYTGWIFVKTKELVKTIITVIEIESREPLFDVKMSIPQEYKNIVAGDNIVGDITIINMGDILPVDINVDYVIKDLNGNVIDIQQETVAAKDLLSITKRMETLKDLKIGDYVFYVKVYYNGNFAMASDLFSIIGFEEKRPSWLAQQLSKVSYSRFIIVIIALMLITTLIILVRKKRKKKTKQPLKRKFKEKPFKEEPLKEKSELKKLVDHIRNNLK